ncbi:hypothetical protein GOODEAATRI_004180, partial [Goodea atripinnis]
SWKAGLSQRDGLGPPPRCLHPIAPGPFVTERNISLAGRANNGEVGKRDSGDPPPPASRRSDNFH